MNSSRASASGRTTLPAGRGRRPAWARPRPRASLQPASSVSIAPAGTIVSLFSSKANGDWLCAAPRCWPRRSRGSVAARSSRRQASGRAPSPTLPSVDALSTTNAWAAHAGQASVQRGEARGQFLAGVVVDDDDVDAAGHERRLFAAPRAARAPCVTTNSFVSRARPASSTAACARGIREQALERAADFARHRLARATRRSP